MKVILTEKPAVAREIAAVLHCHKKENGFISGNGFAITWAFGHLIELCPPENYGWTDWVASSLPMIPDKFLLRPIHIKIQSSGKYVPDMGIVKQLAIIKNLFEKAESIIEATDAGREGELIFRYIYQALSCQKPVQRLWISSLTRASIEKGLTDLQPVENYDRLFYSARARNEADWLVGMNASRALSIAAKARTLSIGRVQTPTLALICRRYMDNKGFTSSLYYTLKIQCVKDGVIFLAHSAPYERKEEADDAFRRIFTFGQASIVNLQIKHQTIQPPLLYDLGSLQQDANRYLGYPAQKTLTIAQELYEKKHITYPRTNSCYIPDDVYNLVTGLLNTLVSHGKYGVYAAALKAQSLNRQSINANKVSDHHAILPTDHLPLTLSGEQQAIYDLIVCRFIQAFYGPWKKTITIAHLTCMDIAFKATGSVTLEAGWNHVKTGLIAEQEESEDTSNNKLPKLAIGSVVSKKSTALNTGQTKPKPIHTEASLLHAMETCGKHLEDPSLRESIKDCGIGTPATRAAIIETLLRRKYIERQKKQLLPTPTGLSVYELVKDKTIASAELTGEWEKRLQLIATGYDTEGSFLEDIMGYTRSITAELMQAAAQVNELNLIKPQRDLLLCPKCQTGAILKGAKNYYCSNYKTGCEFKVWRVIAGRSVTEKEMSELISKGRTKLLKGFISRIGKSFDAALSLDPSWKVIFDFPPTIAPVSDPRDS